MKSLPSHGIIHWKTFLDNLPTELWGGLVWWTPDGMAHALAMNPMQRDATAPRVRLMTIEMLANNFSMNSNSICFSDTGRFMDGRVRAEAVIKSGIPQCLVTTAGIKESALRAIDHFQPRSIGQEVGMYPAPGDPKTNVSNHIAYTNCLAQCINGGEHVAMVTAKAWRLWHKPLKPQSYFAVKEMSSREGLSLSPVAAPLALAHRFYPKEIEKMVEQTRGLLVPDGEYVASGSPSLLLTRFIKEGLQEKEKFGRGAKDRLFCIKSVFNAAHLAALKKPVKLKGLSDSSEGFEHFLKLVQKDRQLSALLDMWQAEPKIGTRKPVEMPQMNNVVNSGKPGEVLRGKAVLALLKNPPKHMEIRWVEMTPEGAEAYKARDTNNRTSITSTVNAYSAEMLTDGWETTGQGGGMSDEGVGLNCRHRMNAIIQSGKSQVMLMVFGLPASAGGTEDHGCLRSHTKEMEADPKVDVEQKRRLSKRNVFLRAAAKLIDTGIKLPTTHSIALWNKPLYNSTAWVVEATYGIKPLHTSCVASALILGHKAHPDETGAFVKNLVESVGAARTKSDEKGKDYDVGLVPQPESNVGKLATVLVQNHVLGKWGTGGMTRRWATNLLLNALYAEILGVDLGKPNSSHGPNYFVEAMTRDPKIHSLLKLWSVQERSQPEPGPEDPSAISPEMLS